MDSKAGGSERSSAHLVATWMTPPQHWVSPDTLLDDAFAVMQSASIRHLLVKENDRLVGVVADRDLRRPVTPEGLVSLQELYLVGDGLSVADVMTKDLLVTIDPEATTADAARMMVSNKINCLPVLRDGRVLGILTTSDLLAALVHAVDPEYAERKPKDES